ncbi:MAG TPA: alpha-ketoglutarate-dependent dioxygenase AlkB [Acidimicrobiia bacterium]|jgi:alkylated DNA repair dioxygenase AlkB
MTIEPTLFALDHEPVRFDLPDADVVYHPRLFDATDADRLFEDLLAGVAWHQDHIRIHGRELPVPRLTAWHGDVDRVYSYSGIDLSPRPWTVPLLEIKQSVEAVVSCAGNWSSNSVLLNQYRDGRDSVAWHADDEPELGIEPVIASVSLGATRRFHMRHRTIADCRLNVELTHGSLLVMRGPTQHHWMHQVPKTAKPVGARINLTYRLVSPSAPAR